MTEKKPKRPRDVSQLAKMMIDEASGESETLTPENQKDPAAVVRGRAGGQARSTKLSPQKRKSVAKVAANARWGSEKA